MTYLPLGLISARKGIRSDTAWKSSMPSLMPTECAIAMRCKTAFVEPPRIMVRTYRDFGLKVIFIMGWERKPYHRIFESGTRHNIPRKNVFLEEMMHVFPNGITFILFFWTFCWIR
jgi:hypothetical protein